MYHIYIYDHICIICIHCFSKDNVFCETRAGMGWWCPHSNLRDFRPGCLGFPRVWEPIEWILGIQLANCTMSTAGRHAMPNWIYPWGPCNFLGCPNTCSKEQMDFVDICSFGIGGSSIGQISDPDEEEKSPVFGLVFTGFGDQCCKIERWRRWKKTVTLSNGHNGW